MYKDVLNSSAVGPRPDYRNMNNIPNEVAQKYRENMAKLMLQAQSNIKSKSK